jgi:hypothetical protein
MMTSKLMKTFLLLVCLGISIISSGCKTPLETSSIPIEQAPIIVEPCVDDPEGDIHIESVTVMKGILDKDCIHAPTPYKSGDSCFLISGQIRNSSSVGYWVAHHAQGYDDEGNEVAFTLDAGPIIGVAQIFIAPGNTEKFTLHLNWSEKAASFTVQSQKSAMMFP